jgi:hypothetical protein
MSDENPRMSGREIGRWLALLALLLACLTAYFLYAPRVPPAIVPAQTTTAP